MLTLPAEREDLNHIKTGCLNVTAAEHGKPVSFLFQCAVSTAGGRAVVRPTESGAGRRYGESECRFVMSRIRVEGHYSVVEEHHGGSTSPGVKTSRLPSVSPHEKPGRTGKASNANGGRVPRLMRLPTEA